MIDYIYTTNYKKWATLVSSRFYRWVVPIIFVIVLICSSSHLYLHAQHKEGDIVKKYGSFVQAVAMSINPLGSIYVIDGGTSEIVKYSTSGKLLTRIGGYGWTQLSFDKPSDIITPNVIDVYVADYGNHRIQRYDRNLNYVMTLSTRERGQTEERFGYPRSIALSKFGALFIVDGENERILKVNNLTVVEKNFGGLSSGKGRLQKPLRIRVSENDIVYVQDGNSLLLFDIFGNYLKALGRDYFQSIFTFTIHKNKLYVLDSCSIVVFGEKGNLEEKVENIQIRLGEKKCDIVDIGFVNENIVFLTKHNILIVRIDEVLKQRKR